MLTRETSDGCEHVPEHARIDNRSEHVVHMTLLMAEVIGDV